MSFDRALYRYEPSPEDVLAANEEIQKHELAIANIQGRIAALQLEAQRLRTEQDKHKAAIRDCQGIITLARRIPEELLSKIFEHCVEDGWTRAPIVVSHVCSAWRRAAHAPRVWSHAYVNCSSPHVMWRTRFWLAMSRQAPLDITLVSTWNPDWQLVEVMDLLLQHAHRWRTLAIEASSVSRVNHLLARLVRASASTPALREVTISTEVHFDEIMDEGETDVRGFAEAFTPESAPRLSTVRYTSNVVPLAPLFPPHLPELELTIAESPFARPLSCGALINLLEDVPALRSLTLSMPLSYEHPFVPLPDPARTVALPALESMTLYGPTDLNELLPRLRTPALRRLHLRSLEDLGYRQQPLAPSLLHFLSASHSQGSTDADADADADPNSDPNTRAAPPIELLELHDIDLAPEAFAAAFTALPNLRELRLHESSLSDATLRLLHGPDADADADTGDGDRAGDGPRGGLCPRLTKLDLRWCGHLSGRALVDLVRSRNCPVDLMRHGEVEGGTPESSAEAAKRGAAGASRADADGDADPIAEVAAINCCFVEEQDVLALAEMTVCRVVMREADDYCRTRDCCGNTRYRTRLRLRHMASLSGEDRKRIRLIV